jgi:hypothetical protein
MAEIDADGNDEVSFSEFSPSLREQSARPAAGAPWLAPP